MLCANPRPINKSQLARVLGMARSSLYVRMQGRAQDKALAVRIKAAQERDDAMGHRKLAVRIRAGKNRVKRDMRTYGIAAQRKRKKYVYRGLATTLAPNKLREDSFEWMSREVVFSDIPQV